MGTRNRTPETYRKWRKDKKDRPFLNYLDYQILKTLQAKEAMRKWEIFIDLFGKDRHGTTLNEGLCRLKLWGLVDKPRYGLWRITSAGNRACVLWESNTDKQTIRLTHMAEVRQDVPP